jgi:outer membrane protein assembly factor BamB
MRMPLVALVLVALPACAVHVEGGSSAGSSGRGGTTEGSGASDSSGGSGTTCPPGQRATPAGACSPLCLTPDANPPTAPWPVFGGCATHGGLAWARGPLAVDIAWRAALPDADPTGGAIMIDASGHLYVSTSTALTSFTADGARRWSTPIDGASAPMVANDGSVVAVTDGGHAVSDYAPDGSLVWTWTSPAKVSPFVGATSSGQIVVTAGAGLFILASDGAVTWSWTEPHGVLMGPLAVANELGDTEVLLQNHLLRNFGPNGGLKGPWIANHSKEPVQSVLTAGAGGAICIPDGDAWYLRVGWDQHGMTTGEKALHDQYCSLVPRVFQPHDGTIVNAVGWNDEHGETELMDWATYLYIPGRPVAGAILDLDNTAYVATTAGIFASSQMGDDVFAFQPADGAPCGAAAAGADGSLYIACGASVYALAP